MPRPARALAAAALVALLAARSLAAPGPLIGWGSTGETGLDWTTNAGRSTSSALVRESNLHGWLGVSLAGALADSRWLAWSWTLRPGFVRSGGNQPDAALQTSEFAHQLTATSQPVPWLRAQFSADRDHLVANRGEEASRESHFAHAEGRGELRTPAFMLGALARSERSDDHWMSTAFAPELERHIDRRAFEAWLESSKLRVMERRTQEIVPGLASEVRTQHTAVDHTLRWGRGSRVTTNLEWNGQSPSALTLVDRVIQEQLHVRHTNWLSTDYRFQDSRTQFVAGEGGNRSHFAELAARTDGVGLAVNGGVRRDHSPGREGSAWSLGPRGSWQRGWRGGARMSAEAGASFEHERRTGPDDARVAIADEAHAVNATRTFTLAVEGVDSATVVVRDASGSAGYVVGVDWNLVRAGASTILVIPLGSRIAIGDLVRVTYEATPPGAPSRHSVRANFALGAEWRGVALRFEDWQTTARDAPVDRGAAGLEQAEQALTLNAGVPRGPARLDVSASERRRVLEGSVTRTDDGQASLSCHIGMAWLAAAEVAASNAREAGGRLGARSQRVSLGWNPGGPWRCGGHAELAQFDRAGAPELRQQLAGADVSARWGLLDAALRVDAGARNGVPDHRFQRVWLTVRRRLR